MNKANAWLVGTVSAAAISGAAYLEGTRYTPYYDIAGVLTVCEGYTGGQGAIIPNKRYTPDECKAYRKKELQVHGDGVLKCTQAVLTQSQFDAMTLFAYNVGVEAYCGSSPRKLFDAGKPRAACDALLAWSKARVNGVLVTVKGLLNRRNFERDICLKGTP